MPKLSDYTDQITNATLSITYEHHEIHEGSHFYISDFETKAVGEIIEFIITTPNTLKWTHLTFSIQGSDGVQLEVYRDPTGIVGGASAVPLNSNENSTKASSLTMVKDPTSIAGDGDRLFGYSGGANNKIGFVNRSNEIILKQDTTYLFRITSLGNGNILSYTGEWYEHTNKNQ